MKRQFGVPMVKDYPIRTKSGWYIARMGFLEWLETALKLASIGFGIAALAKTLPLEGLSFPGSTALFQIVVLGFISVVLLGAIFGRILQRELFAIAFVIVNNIGHWGLLFSILYGLDEGLYVIGFSSLMLAGDLTKLAFFVRTGFTLRGIPRNILLAQISLFALGYLLIIVAEIIG